MWPRKSVFWAILATGLVSASVFAAVQALNSSPITFQVLASADTYVCSDCPTGPHGAAPVLWVTNAPPSAVSWSLVAFNLFGKLKPGDLVVDAKITLTVTSVQGRSWPASIRTGRILTNWSETSTTWTTKPMVVFDTSTTTILQSPNAGERVQFDVTKQLSRWHSYGGPSNYGTALMMWENVTDAGVGFASRENPTQGPPTLTLTYQPGPSSIYSYAATRGDLLTRARLE